MKNQLKYSILAILVLTMFGVSSCLKDDAHLWDFSNDKPMIEIPESPNPATGLIVRTIEIHPTVDVSLPINLAAPSPASTSITITLAVDTSVLGAKNRALLAADSLATPYELLPDSVYTVSSWDVTIPAGKNLVQFPITILAEKIDLNASYLLPISIKAVPAGYTIASNFSNALLQVVLKNNFDGIYAVNGTFEDYIGTSWKGYYPKTIYLITSGPNSVYYYDTDLEGCGYIFDTGAGLSYFGNFGPMFYFDTDGNITSCGNYYVDPAPRSRNCVLRTDQGVANKRDASGNIDVAYSLYQATVTPNLRNLIIEHFVYQGPRN